MIDFDKKRYYYDKKAAERVILFIQQCCTHVKGELARSPLILENWQKEDIIKPLFGIKEHRTGLRKYRTCYIEIPRKNAKSTLSAALALTLLLIDGEEGAEIYSAASDRGQAGLVFEVAKHMVLQNKYLSEQAHTYRNSIVKNNTPSFYQPISADADTKHGFNAHGIIYDELHTAPNRDLWDVLTTSTGARRQPLVVAITTAGYDKTSICYEMHDYSTKLLKGVIKDDTFLPVIYSADPEDDIYIEETWKKANPGYGSIVKSDYISQEAQKAKNIPSYENTFKRLHLNIWTSSKSKWLPDDLWMKGAKQIPELKNKQCFGGLDLASTSDINALVLLFFHNEQYYVLPFFWLPEDAVKDAKRHNVPYDVWVKQGHLSVTPGNVTDYDFIRAKVNELNDLYDIYSIAYDRYNSSQLVNNLLDDGFVMTPFGQGYQSMSNPTKELERLVKKEKVIHGGNPVLRWMNDNVEIQTNATLDIKITKDRDNQYRKVDGMVSLVMALGEMITYREKETEPKIEWW